MVISCSTCEKEEKECIQVKYLIDAVCRNFNFVAIYLFFFSPIVYSQNFRVHKKNVFFCPSLHDSLLFLSLSSSRPVVSSLHFEDPPLSRRLEQYTLGTAPAPANAPNLNKYTSYYTLNTVHCTPRLYTAYCKCITGNIQNVPELVSRFTWQNSP